MEWVLLKTFLSLLLVLGLMYGLAFLYKKYFLSQGKQDSSQVEIELLGRRTLGPKRSVAVLKVFDRVIVVGMTEDGMRTLSEMPDPRPPIEVTAGEPGAKQPAGRSFGDYLSAYLHVAPRKKTDPGIDGRISQN
jgi:flagellar biosynthetic protein FliO